MASMLIEPDELVSGGDLLVFDCRFSLTDPLAGRRCYESGHIPGAYFLDLDRDLSGPVRKHGGRHPLPDPGVFADTLAGFGVGPDSDVVAYDDSRLASAARLWWLMRALGYRAPRLLNGGYQGFLHAGGHPAVEVPPARPCQPMPVGDYAGYCGIEGVKALQAGGAVLVDSREPRRYQGLEEPIDPVAGHIPGAINRPWQGVTAADGTVLDGPGLQSHWGEALDSGHLVVYCGSGVTACVNLFSLALLGHEDATLYAGSWSDWCSHC